MPSLIRRLIPVLLLAALGACAQPSRQEVQFMSDNTETQTAQPWRTVCVGRIMMQLPGQYPLDLNATLDFGKITRLPPMSQSKFWQTVENERAKYASLTHREAPSQLAHFEKIGATAAMVFFYRTPHARIPNLSRFLYLDSTHAYRFDTGSLSDDEIDPNPELFQPFVDRYGALLREPNKFQPLGNGEIPTQPGFCIDGALVRGDTRNNSSSGVNVSMRSNVNGKVNTIGFGHLENIFGQNLRSTNEEFAFDEQRADIALKLSEPLGFKRYETLRKRLLTLDGITGQEVVTRTERNNGWVSYSAQWGTKGSGPSLRSTQEKPDQPNGGVVQPTITAWLKTPFENPDHPSGDNRRLPDGYRAYAPDSFLQFWDRYLRTFRQRPGAMPSGTTIQSVN